MRSLSQIILLLFLAVSLFAQSPHGDELTIKCEECHNPNGWKLVKGTYTFDHNKSTGFPLEGQHQSLDCKMCHTTLVFSKAEPDCASCHTDIHEQTVGFDCQRCHTPKSWIVNNIIDIHRQSRFPLLGPHATADCQQCHQSASLLKFEPLGIECIDCHRADYESTTNPNHVESNFSTNCVECHNMNVFSWTGSNFNHSFFPLTEGHAINNCTECHTNGNDYTTLSPDCFSCHESDYNTTSNPSHIQADISINCAECHSTKPGWKPAEFKQHDAQYFPIYSGKHNGEWNNCTDCHSDPSNYMQFTCIDCHEHNPGDTDEEHHEVGGYQYNSVACLECHPQGSAEDGFDHNMTNFPLTGAHTTTDCASCHTDGYQGTPTTCISCHETDFNQSINPNHNEIGLSTECESCHTTAPDWVPATFDIHNDFYFLSGAHASVANDCFSCHQGDYNNTPNTCTECHISDFNQTTNPNHNDIGLSNVCDVCHTTDPEWKPAQFPVHNDYYVLAGAHATIANDCYTCHNGDYNNTPNACVGCHLQDYNQTTDPPHESSGFSTECETCHNSTAWSPSTFDHDGQYFPIYSGKHQGEWENCNECHTTPNNFTAFSCIDCHEHNQADTDEHHQGIGGYSYNSDACYACHPTGDGEGGFNHDLTNFPLTGAHLSVDCLSCHEDGYAGTTTVCFECHSENYNGSQNPDHIALNIPNVCDDCHTTAPNWEPAQFPIHNDYYELAGAHVSIDCASCHDGDYNNTPNTCFGCHESDYNQTEDPPHETAQFPTDCENCHTQNAWVPSTFDHDGQYFPIYSGKHNNEWDQCADCHSDPGNYQIFSCLTCHHQTETDEEHQEVGGYSYNSDACYACHPTGNADDSFNHNLTNFPLTGAHIGVDCLECHEDGYQGTTTFCYDCHTDNYNQSANPDHQALNIPNVCDDCHTTAPNWEPALYTMHDEVYELVGAHVSVNCASCHDGNYNETPNTCAECHISEYNESTDPDHTELNLPTTCEDCHTPSPGWEPADFAIHDDYYELTGAHTSVDCNSCHESGYNDTPNNCAGCHMDNYNGTTNPDHVDLSLPTTCEDCHTTSPGWEPADFAIHDDYYELTGAHTSVDCNSCHESGYNDTPNTCAGCHMDNYNGTTNPDHVDLNLPTTCEDCHTTSPGWEPADFAIHDDYYPLNGAHVNVDCNSCHNGNYDNTPNTCFGCHENDYNQTTDPPHLSEQFPTDCEMCHTEVEWEPSTFDHDNQYFPIYSGQHNGEWNQCIDCHTTPGNFQIFDCINCHTDAHHQDQGNIGCYNCHPDGSEGDKKFNSVIKSIR